MDAYASCPCGSGKKFKWCCQPIHVEIDRAFQQDSEGQHEAALRIMEQVVADNQANPEAWGRKAQLLYQNDRVEDAEQALQKAFDINPNYPFGHLLRGVFRNQEGEMAGALVCFRKAANAYDPESRDLLAQVYGMIAEIEIKLNRPLACHAALLISIHCNPSQPELKQNLEAIFGPESRLPASARQDYRFLSPADGMTGERRKAWDQALATAGSPRLSDAAKAFEALTQADGNDMAAWYNLALARAWLGNNAGALEALDRYVTLETDEGRASAAWALAEVLRCGQGMEEQADYVEHSVMYQVRDPRPIFALFEEWERARRLTGVQITEDQRVINAIVLDTGPVLTAGLSPGQLAKLGAHLLMVPGILRLWHTNKESLTRIRQEVEKQAGQGITDPQAQISHIAFHDVILEALAFPVSQGNEEEAKQRIFDHAQRYFEVTWIHRPLRSLNRIASVDAGSHAGLRKKLMGVIQFLQECAAPTLLAQYDFNRLRQKLGLPDGQGPPEPAIPAQAAAAAAAATPAVATAPPSRDLQSMSAADLTSLSADSLSDDELAQAWQTAQKLDAQDLADQFASALIARPLQADRPDRFPWYAYLAQRALGTGDTDKAMNLVNEGERVDSEANEGRHQNDYELRRGQIHAKRGEADLAHEAFARLIERAPTELKFRGNAAEAMLGLKQKERALRFAEEGLTKARQQNDRDSEHYFLELTEAAKK